MEDQEIKRKAYTIKYKRTAVRIITDLVSKGKSVREAADQLNIPHFYYARWKEHIKKFDALETSIINVGGDLRKLHMGRPSFLETIREDLSRSIFEWRERGLQVTPRLVLGQASVLSSDFKDKSTSSKKSMVYRFVKKLGLTQRIATHVAQKSHQETEAEAKNFVAVMRDKVSYLDPDHIINMDQTPIPFSFHSSRTLEKIGTRTIHVSASTAETKRATLAVTVSASGNLLPPFLIFKGKTGGRIARTEFQTYPEGCFYACQDKAWMDEAMMNLWIDLVLEPWKDTLPPHIIPLLILDAYRVHMMGSIVNRIQGMGIEVQHIPAGCTYLCQPVDVGVNRPIKKHLMDRWEHWLFEEGGFDDGVMKTPTRKMIAEWVVPCYNAISVEVGRNAWKKRGYEWFN